MWGEGRGRPGDRVCPVRGSASLSIPQVSTTQPARLLAAGGARVSLSPREHLVVFIEANNRDTGRGEIRAAKRSREEEGSLLVVGIPRIGEPLMGHVDILSCWKVQTVASGAVCGDRGGGSTAQGEGEG